MKVNKQFYTLNKEYYNKNAIYYENSSWYYFNKYKSYALKKDLQKIIKNFSKEINILEIGPGTGYLLDHLNFSKKKIQYLGIDHSSQMTKFLIKKYKKKYHKFKILNLSLKSNNTTKILKKKKFDLILGSSILHHFPKYEIVINKLFERLNDNGIMYFNREPLGKSDCIKPKIYQKIFSSLIAIISNLILSSFIKKILYPKKIKAANAKNIAIHMFKNGVSLKPFKKLKSKGCKIIIFRKYNRRITSFLMNMENNILSNFKSDIFGNTMFAISLKKVK
jgi:2-polyprenyl-3-methyl-5-hydroxy-6-metoxy-1,4-benzoquinol methylase